MANKPRLPSNDRRLTGKRRACYTFPTGKVSRTNIASVIENQQIKELRKYAISFNKQVYWYLQQFKSYDFLILYKQFTSILLAHKIKNQEKCYRIYPWWVSITKTILNIDLSINSMQNAIKTSLKDKKLDIAQRAILYF